MTDLSRCPKCDGPADNGYDREVPPNPYHCTKCMAELQGCVLCNHPMYAGIKCRLCGKVTVPAPPPDAQTEAEKVAYCAGWWAALETARKAEPVQETDKSEQGRMRSAVLGNNVKAMMETGLSFMDALDTTLKVYDHPPKQPAQEPVANRAFLERILIAMEGVIDVADRKTDEFDALRSCVIDLTLMLHTAPHQRKEKKDD